MERHEAIVAGAGPAGLAVAAMMRRRGFGDVLVLERAERPGDRWRRRYDGLRLNTMRTFSSLPRFRMSRSYGRYPSRDGFVAYLEAYATRHELELRCSTELRRVEREGEDWRLETSAAPMLARYAVIATGYDALPKLPDWARPEEFPGELIHAAEYRSAARYADREVLVVGAGNSGVDIAGQLVAAGADVSVAMRTPPNLFPRDLFGIPLQPSGILADYGPARLGDATGRLLQRIAFGNLEPYGIPPAPEGFQTKFRRHLVGPAVDDGFVAALKAGRTRIVPAVERQEEGTLVLADGARIEPDAVICATGYRRGLEPLVGHLGVLREDGIPLAHDGAPAHDATPRLYFAGFWGSPSGQVRVMPGHARRIARDAARDRRRAAQAA